MSARLTRRLSWPWRRKDTIVLILGLDSAGFIVGGTLGLALVLAGFAVAVCWVVWVVAEARR
jgi:hypothetical protein